VDIRTVVASLQEVPREGGAPVVPPTRQVVGTDGELERTAAVLHPRFNAPVRAAIGGGGGCDRYRQGSRR